MFILKRDYNPLHLMHDEGTIRLFVDLVIKDKNSFPTEINNIEFNGLIDQWTLTSHNALSLLLVFIPRNELCQ